MLRRVIKRDIIPTGHPTTSVDPDGIRRLPFTINNIGQRNKILFSNKGRYRRAAYKGYIMYLSRRRRGVYTDIRE